MSGEDDSDDKAPESGKGGLLGRIGGAVSHALFEPTAGDEDGDEDDESAKKSKAKAKGAPARPAQRPATAFPNAATLPPGYAVGVAQPTAGVEIDKEFAAILERETGEAAKPAFTAYAETEQSMREDVPIDAARMKAALKVIGRQGHSAAAVLTDVDECLQAIDARQQAVEQSFVTKVAEKVGGLQTQAEELARTLAAKQQQIAALQQECGQLEQQRQSTLASVNTERTKMERKRDGMIAAINAYRSRWQTIRQTLQTITGAQ